MDNLASSIDKIGRIICHGLATLPAAGATSDRPFAALSLSQMHSIVDGWENFSSFLRSIQKPGGCVKSLTLNELGLSITSDVFQSSFNVPAQELAKVDNLLSRFECVLLPRLVLKFLRFKLLSSKLDAHLNGINAGCELKYLMTLCGLQEHQVSADVLSAFVAVCLSRESTTDRSADNCKEVTWDQNLNISSARLEENISKIASAGNSYLQHDLTGEKGEDRAPGDTDGSQTLVQSQVKHSQIGGDSGSQKKASGQLCREKRKISNHSKTSIRSSSYTGMEEGNGGQMKQELKSQDETFYHGDYKVTHGLSSSVSNNEVITSEDKTLFSESVQNYGPCEQIGRDREDFTAPSPAQRIRLKRGEQLACTVCGLAFVGYAAWKNHSKLHLGLPLFHCLQCEYLATKKEYLHAHVRQCHSAVDKYKCQWCPEHFSNLRVLWQHKLTHKMDLKYTCDHCHRRFRMKDHLVVHLRNHVGAKPYHCKFCPRSFSEANRRRKHQKSHSGERSYVCEICGQAFANGPCLKSHLKSHSGEKPYKCQHCPYATRYRSNLAIHMVIHTSSGPHRCDVCAASFKNVPNLTRHLRTHTRQLGKDGEVARRLADSQLSSLNVKVKVKRKSSSDPKFIILPQSVSGSSTAGMQLGPANGGRLNDLTVNPQIECKSSTGTEALEVIIVSGVATRDGCYQEFSHSTAPDVVHLHNQAEDWVEESVEYSYC